MNKKPIYQRGSFARFHLIAGRICLTNLCLLILTLSNLWITACANGNDGFREVRGIVVEKADVAVFPQLGHFDLIDSIAFSPDGKYIASGSSDGTVKLWDGESGRDIYNFYGHNESVYSVAFSPDGKQLVSGSEDETVKLWDAATGKEIKTISWFSGTVKSVVFSPDGKYIASSFASGQIKLWDPATGEEIRSFFGYRDVGSSIALSPDGKYIISDSGAGIIKLWDVESGREIRTFSGYSKWVYSLAFSPDGKIITSGYSDGIIKLWDVASGREIRTFSGHSERVHSVAFSPDGKYVVSGSGYWTLSSRNIDNTVKLWDVASGREIRTFTGHSHAVSSVAFSPDGNRIASASWDETVKIWDVGSGKEISTFSGYSKAVSTVSFSPDGKYIVSGSANYILSLRDNTIKLWDVTSGREIRTFSGHSGNEYSSIIYSVVFSPDGKYIASGADDYTIKLWDVTSGREVRSFTDHSASVTSVTFSLDGKYIASGSNDQTVRLWDVTSGREIRSFTGHRNSVNSVAFSPDGKYIASGSDDNTVKLWDITTGREIRSFTGHSEAVMSVAFSPNGKNIASGSHEGTVRLWEVGTGRQIGFFGHSSEVIFVTFSPDGKHIASISKNIKLWDVTSGKEIREFSGYSSRLSSISFSPDGRKLASSSIDGTTRIWDVAAGKELVSFISFSGSDNQLATATRGLTVETKTASSSVDGEWLSITPDGYYQSSPRGDRYLNVRVGNTVTGIDSYRSIFYNPDVVQARLAGKPDPASKGKATIQQAASFAPPTVTIQSPSNFSTTTTATANLSVAITDNNQPIKNIRVFVNGRPAGRNELEAVKGTGLQAARTGLTVTGNLKTVNFTMPLDLDPGTNRIEVVAFNGFSDTRRYVDVTWNAPAGQRPPLPNLWILAVGVNSYQESTIQNLNFCVADAKGVIDSLKAQEGRRYAKVNSLLIADGESLLPTAENIRKNLTFLDQAGDRDIVLLFLAGHGVSAQEGKFFFLPRDATMTGNVVNASRAISGDELVAVLEGSGRRMLFIDACQSGGVDNDRMVRALQESNAFVFTASRGNELSEEHPRLGHGVFTYSILNALRGAPAALAEGNVSVRSMSGFVSLEVPRLTGNRQNPQIYSLLYCDFPLAVIR